jgi:hypothetical protein
MNRVIAAWDGFWFGPVPARSLGWMRASLGALLVIGHLLLLRELLTLYSPVGPVPVAAAVESLPWPRFSYLDWVADPDALLWVHLLGLIPYVGLMLGWKSRTMAWLALLVQVALYHRNPFAQHGGDRVFRLATLAVALGPSGAALSIDAWLAARRGEPFRAWVPAITHRLVQIQLVVIYMNSGWVKAKGKAWEDGSALYYALSNGQYQRAPDWLEPLLVSHEGQAILRLGTWMTLGWEAAFGLLVLWRPTRIAALAIGVLVHGGIFALMMVGSFSLAMLWCYQAFLPWIRGGTHGTQPS